ncbi:MAG: hypothetical protein CO030_01340 [Candidatus Magasanikbacteria bacterium CG_4_9_14_0_2_um_filter_42_11]|uniref:Uncharacterized protein n=1 Tax=Candidatus Magasanikbacteria bacterium CG_4_9_14_0_2_um_filter_42_11 TaxID=1974643 RepID=A0A2M8FAI9_9BACT|nr:MAG: hypothetical protein CO030_01340 [Candidatus Magasanikbacteria bacterium CG_4_9_14_0_2_um_filter_42_11]
MNAVMVVFAMLCGFFVLLLVIKKYTAWQFCVLCASVSLTWMSLLVLYWLASFADPVLIAVLMGQSVVGIYYLLEKKVPESLLLFRFPFFLTATALVFVMLGYAPTMMRSLFLLVLLWFITIGMYAYKSNPKVQQIIEEFMNCCKNW